MHDVKLHLDALSDLETDGAAAFPVLRVTGNAPHARLTTEPGQSVALAPGEYFVEIEARALEGALRFELSAVLAGGGLRSLDLVSTAPGVWRSAFTTLATIETLDIAFHDAGAFIFVGASIRTDGLEEQPAPSLIGGAVMLARAAFRKLPQSARRAIVGSASRAKWLARVRDAAETPAEGRSGGRIMVGGEADSDGAALRADFENRLAIARGAREASYVDETSTPAPSRPGAKLIAFHLPQFHPIPENDAWWGAGFTEWANVAKAAPQFLGHMQPRLPGELGFYDLRTPGVLKQQANLARAHGVSAFCFHYYWFAGKRLLEAPLDAFVADRSIDIEFCLCWANENWTRRWDGAGNEILIAQDHSLEDHRRVFADLARYAEDPRYLRIDGKPLLVVYRPDIIPNAHEMTALWREQAAKLGWKGVYLVATNAFRFDKPARLGFDALVEFPPHGFVADRIDPTLRWLNQRHGGAVYDYGAVAAAEVRRMNAAGQGRHPVFPGVMPGWDNEARRPGAGVVYHCSTPEAYGAWLRAAISRAERSLPHDRQLVFINAWNEWAEGAYLEPDRTFGRAYLAATARAFIN
jgi:hypothetical protein